ncbi:hypothetical protein DPMN_091369 [Dreissena polymorpha]|uniref:Uncharacterized protein n=1 Tax=Dreissena polymorpha TaxID=45954 RepID=A0A9D4QZ63_DREPO|nr:hypothetical protein DPMN_091369 [Dreissena polymorpha]
MEKITTVLKILALLLVFGSPPVHDEDKFIQNEPRVNHCNKELRIFVGELTSTICGELIEM